MNSSIGIILGTASQDQPPFFLFEQQHLPQHKHPTEIELNGRRNICLVLTRTLNERKKVGGLRPVFVCSVGGV